MRTGEQTRTICPSNSLFYYLVKRMRTKFELKNTGVITLSYPIKADAFY
jgi:hypothetical protein